MPTVDAPITEREVITLSDLGIGVAASKPGMSIRALIGKTVELHNLRFDGETPMADCNGTTYALPKMLGKRIVAQVLQLPKERQANLSVRVQILDAKRGVKIRSTT